MRGLVFSTLFLVSTSATASDLVSVYQDAYQNSPLLKNYWATRAAVAEGTPIALGSLLPQIAVTGNATETHLSASGMDTSYPSMGYNISLTQPLFNYTNYASVAGASANSSAAEATYQSNLQNFILMVGTDYFDVLLAAANVKFAQANVDSLKETLDQTERQFQVGIVPYTNVLEAKANYAAAVATLLANQNTLADTQQNLMTLTGKPESNFATLKDDFPFVPPSPNNSQAWVDAALQNNQALQAQHYITKAALATVNQAVGAQLPSVDLVVNYGQNFYRENVPPMVSPSSQWSGLTVALQFDWTVFSGGEQMATNLQAANQYASAQNVELNLYRQTTMQIQQDYLSVLSNISEVKAYEASVIAAESSLKNYNAQYKVGTATIVDVLNANQTLYQAKSNLATAANDYIESLLQLKYEAGNLSKDDLLNFNQYLQITQ